MGLLFLLYAAAAGAAPPTAPAAGIACTYLEARPADVADLGKALVGHARERVDALRLALVEPGHICQRRLGWSDEQTELANRYAASRAGYEEAEQALRRRGMGALIDQVDAKLPVAVRARVVAGGSADALFPYVTPIFRQWQARKIPLADAQAAATLLGSGLVYRLMRDDAEERFGKAGAPPLAAPPHSG